MHYISIVMIFADCQMSSFCPYYNIYINYTLYQYNQIIVILYDINRQFSSHLMEYWLELGIAGIVGWHNEWCVSLQY